MATNKRSSRNNNPEGRNQYSNSWLDSARDRPLTAAAAVGGAIAAGVFLWSRRNQISEEVGRLGEQIGEWRDSMQSDESFEQASTDAAPGFIAKANKAKRGKARNSQQEIAEEAPTLKDSAQASTRPLDPVIEDQFKVGAVAY